MTKDQANLGRLLLDDRKSNAKKSMSLVSKTQKIYFLQRNVPKGTEKIFSSRIFFA